MIHSLRPGWMREYALGRNGPMWATDRCRWPDLGVKTMPYMSSTFIPHAECERSTYLGLLAVSGAKIIETKTNDRLLTTMLRTFMTNPRAFTPIWLANLFEIDQIAGVLTGQTDG